MAGPWGLDEAVNVRCAQMHEAYSVITLFVETTAGLLLTEFQRRFTALAPSLHSICRDMRPFNSFIHYPLCSDRLSHACTLNLQIPTHSPVITLSIETTVDRNLTEFQPVSLLYSTLSSSRLSLRCTLSLCNLSIETCDHSTDYPLSFSLSAIRWLTAIILCPVHFF
jgi:hypothetical protein